MSGISQDVGTRSASDARVRASMHWNIRFVSVATIVAGAVVGAGRLMGFATFSWTEIAVDMGVAIGAEALIAIAISRVRTITNAIRAAWWWSQHGVFFGFFGYAVSFAGPMRPLLLTQSFLAVIFLVLSESARVTLLFLATIVAVYLGVSYLCIYWLGQPGNLAYEAYVALSALPVGGFMAMLNGRFIAQRRALAEARREAEERSEQLTEISARLAETNAHLEERVQQGVAEVVARARDIEILNAHLKERVRDRSREIAATIARFTQATNDTPGALAAGTILAQRVQIDGFLAAGGMGAVYRATDLVSGAKVVVKVIQVERAARMPLLYRFLGETAAMAAVGHPAIVNVLHVDVAEDGTLFYTAEFVDGETFEGLVSRKALNSAGVARVGSVIASALAAAHSAGVVHRDIKPSNLMLTRVAPGVRVVDFGISKVTGRDDQLASQNLTATGEILGTPAYMAPEQILDPAAAGPATDIYSMGLVLYELVAGRGPYDCATIPQYFMAHQLQAPRPLEEVRPHVAKDLAVLIHACLAKSPAQRPTAASIAEQLEVIAFSLGAPAAQDLADVHRNDDSGHVDPVAATVRDESTTN